MRRRTHGCTCATICWQWAREAIVRALRSVPATERKRLLREAVALLNNTEAS
jgi:hypothetical protein